MENYVDVKAEAEKFEEEAKFQGELNKKPEPKESFIKKGVNFVKRNKGKIIAGAGIAAVGIISFVLGTKVNRRDEDDYGSDEIKMLGENETEDEDWSEEEETEDGFDIVEDDEEEEETED